MGFETAHSSARGASSPPRPPCAVAHCSASSGHRASSCSSALSAAAPRSRAGYLCTCACSTYRYCLYRSRDVGVLACPPRTVSTEGPRAWRRCRRSLVALPGPGASSCSPAPPAPPCPSFSCPIVPFSSQTQVQSYHTLPVSSSRFPRKLLSPFRAPSGARQSWRPAQALHPSQSH